MAIHSSLGWFLAGWRKLNLIKSNASQWLRVLKLDSLTYRVRRLN